MLETGCFEVKAMTLHVAEHLLNPHATTVKPNGSMGARKAGGQIPGLALATRPVQDQISDGGIGGGQIDEEVRKYAGADAYGRDAMTGVTLAKKWLGGK